MLRLKRAKLLRKKKDGIEILFGTDMGKQQEAETDLSGFILLSPVPRAGSDQGCLLLLKLNAMTRLAKVREERCPTEDMSHDELTPLFPKV